MNVAVVQRDVNRSGSLEREADILVRELVALGVETHVYCDARSRDRGLTGAVFHDVRAHGATRAARIASFAVEATSAVRAGRSSHDVVHVNGVAGWEHDVVRVHEVVAAAQARWPHEAGAEYSLAHARAAAAPVLHPALGVARSVQRLQLRTDRYRGVLAVTDAVRDDLVERMHVPPELIEVVPYPIDVQPADGAAVRRRLGIAPQSRLLLFVGHAFARKGLGHLVAALAELPPDVVLVAVGNPSPAERDAVLRAAARARVADRLHLVGSDEPAAYYAAADLFVLPTTHDAWGATVTEAMAEGLPIVVTRAAGSAALVERAGAGVVVDRAHPRELRDAIAPLLADAPRRAGMAAAGQAAVAPLGARAFAERTLAAYARFATAQPTGIASFPGLQPLNPYQRLLYDHLRPHGFELRPSSALTLHWLVRERRRVRVVHVHWPEGMYTLQRGPRALRPAGSWVKLALFAARLAAARALGYRIVWTVHQVRPHRRSARGLDRAGTSLLAAAADLLVVHDDATRLAVARAFHRDAAVVPHGSYAAAYPPGRSREEVRGELGVDDRTFLFVTLGELRADKSTEQLIRAFRDLPLARVRLVVAGMARDPRVRATLRTAAAGDERVLLRFGFVPEAHVRELFEAADAAVIARTDGGTSGSLVLPLSFGVPVVAADLPAYRALTGGEDAGWLFAPGDPASLRDALERAASSRMLARRRGAAARTRALALDWTPIAAQLARHLREACA
jgi:glycosyltransferase involved in cell wall biosynthesis